MCEAEFPNVETLDQHIDLLHGQYRFYSTWLGGAYSQCPYVISPTEKRACIEHFAAVQQQAVSAAENEPYVELPEQEWQQKQLWAYLYEICANEAKADADKLIHAKLWAGVEEPPGPYLYGAVYVKEYEPRSFEACVFCVMLQWSEHLKSVYIAGEYNEMKDPAAVADLLSVDWYSKQWPFDS